MEIKDWIMIITAVFVVIGWFVNSYLNRKHEVAKKRLDYRLEVLIPSVETLLILRNSLEGKEDIDKDRILKLHQDFQLYADQDELELLNKFIKTGNLQEKNNFLTDEPLANLTP
ncbi:MAG: hypothetical protein PHX59_08200 [Sulfuricurvum sp.]|nr:hypothetical protein [Sulfuricurvum sp.]